KQYVVSGPNFGGLSGVVYGLLGFCWLYSFGRRTPLWLPPGLIVFMVGWLILGYTGVLWVNIANEAHLAGLLSGCLAGVVVRLLNPTPR
ncbi:MAG TPA: rhomboid family intramembrane serine protease, partial [Idiomarina sp.]|nr:rhomboid family intramembrane serine protease [Idiomarina sp.]